MVQRNPNNIVSSLQAVKRGTSIDSALAADPVGPRLRMQGFSIDRFGLNSVMNITGSAVNAHPAGPAALHNSEVDGLVRRARLILSAMNVIESGRNDASFDERRAGTSFRRRFEVQGWLHLWAEGEYAEPWFVFARNVEPRGLGFIAPDRLPLGYGGTLKLDIRRERPLAVDVSLVRCRSCSSGWFEGGMTFTRPQHIFSELLDSGFEANPGDA